jgi:hypothetical protein
MIQPIDKLRVTPAEMRRIFKVSGVHHRINSGRIREVLSRDDPQAPPNSREPSGTHSQILAFFDRDDNKIAVVHQYKRPDGSTGGSGQPEPKRILIGRTVYFV